MSGWPEILTPNEVKQYVDGGTLPDDFRERLRIQLDLLLDGVISCPNCDNVHCMHFVLRDWWSGDFDKCDRWCCPFCSELKDDFAARQPATAQAVAPKDSP